MNTQAIAWTKGQYNPGGINDIYYGLPEEIATFPAAADPSTATTFSSLVELADPIVMKTGKRFWPLYATLETGELKATIVGNRDGKGYENSADFSFPGSQSDFEGFKAWMANRDIILIVREKNGVLRVLGDLEDPAFLDTDASTSGKKIADSRASVLTFKANNSTSAKIYMSTIDSLLTPAA